MKHIAQYITKYTMPYVCFRIVLICFYKIDIQKLTLEI